MYDPYDAAAQLTRIKARRVLHPLANGATCASGGECTSGFCAGGICCDTACTTGTCSYPPATATGQDPLAVSYSRAAGSLFALGPTTVTATVTDGLGRTASCTFGVTVRDTTWPTLSCEPDRVVEATSPSGAPVPCPQDVVVDAPPGGTGTPGVQSMGP